MGIQRCPKCGKFNNTNNNEVSNCSNCGFPLPRTNYKLTNSILSRPLVKKVLIGLVVFCVISAIINGCQTSKTTTSKTTTTNTTQKAMYRQLGLSSEASYSKVIETLSKIDGFTKITDVRSLGIEEGIRGYWLILEGYDSKFVDNDTVVRGDCFWLGFKDKTDNLDSFYVNGNPVYENGKILCSIKKYTIVSVKDLNTAFYVIERQFKRIAKDPSSIELNINDVRYGKSEGVINITGSVYGKNSFNATTTQKYIFNWNVLTGECDITIDGVKYMMTFK